MQKRATFLVTGGGGFLGSVLVPMLLADGHKVKVLDRFFWGTKVFNPHLSNKNLTLIEADTRSFPAKILKNVDTVIDLAALSNDPTGELNPKITLEINHKARLRTAKLAKKMGARRYILASSCSVYGFKEGIIDEKSSTSPVTTYARASLLAEQSVLPLSDKKFSVTVLRQGTLYGLSPRMRFDIVLNTMVLSFFKNNFISVSGGEQWRPILHVKDSARAFVEVASAPVSKVNGQVFNVGANKQNYKIKDLAKEIMLAVGDESKIITQDVELDFRSYRVSFNKIKSTLGFKTIHTPRNTAKEIMLALKKGEVSDSPETRTIEWYKYLISKNKKLLE